MMTAQVVVYGEIGSLFKTRNAQKQRVIDSLRLVVALPACSLRCESLVRSFSLPF